MRLLGSFPGSLHPALLYDGAVRVSRKWRDQTNADSSRAKKTGLPFPRSIAQRGSRAGSEMPVPAGVAGLLVFPCDARPSFDNLRACAARSFPQ